MGRSRDKEESNYDFCKRMLLRYKELHGNLIIRDTFRIPWSLDWPDDMWDVPLGKMCIF